MKRQRVSTKKHVESTQHQLARESAPGSSEGRTSISRSSVKGASFEIKEQ